ncbi:MAG: aldo/keto reductase, partial [Gammaproteobacteria bacterium]|nr:aldo/keto reductase [Gammaproteobacteria bacterium]
MVTRRDCLKYTAAASAALTLKTKWLQAQEVGPLIQRPIPSTGELLPIVGLGSSATFSDVADQDDIAGVRSVLTALLDN